MQVDMRIRTTIPVTQTERTMEGRTEEDTADYRVTKTVEDTATFTAKYEGAEEIAEVIVELLLNPQEYVQNMVPKEMEEEYQVSTSHDVEISGMLSRASQDSLEAIYLAASEMARYRTEQSLSRTGTSIEQVLLRWHDMEFDEYADTSGQEIDFDDFQRMAKTVLYAYCITDQTPGQRISDTTIPEAHRIDNDKDEMMIDPNA